MRLDAGEVYVSGGEAQEKTYNPLELEYPYIVSGEPAGVVSYGPLVRLEYENASRDVFRVTQESGSFLLPHTGGDYRDIDDDEEEVVNRRFLDQLRPSFSYEIPENPLVKVYLQPDRNVTGFSGEQTGLIELAVRKTLEDSDRVLLRPQ